MIEKLTSEQIAKFSEYVEKWKTVGLCTKRANRQLAEKYCREAYKAAGLSEPKFIFWAQSPIGLLLTAKLIKELAAKGYAPYAAAEGGEVRAQVRDQVRDQVGDQVWAQVRDQVGDQVRDQVRDQVGDQVWDQVWAQVGDQVGDQVRDQVGDQVGDQVRDQVGDQVWDQVGATSLRSEWNELYSYGQHDAGWLSFYSYFNEVCGLEKETQKLQPLINLSKETGWQLFYKDIAILSEKPTAIHLNERGQLHNFNGPALKWADGYELCMFNGVRLTGKEHYAYKQELTKEDILKEENVDVRRELIKKIGTERAEQILGSKTVDAYDSPVGGKYELVLIDYTGVSYPYLKMISKSIDATHLEGVETKNNTVKEAIMFRNDLLVFEEPEHLS